ncbi:MAG TPA: ATP-binding cassette domain-containing protein, partial [Clostridia bacterium]|nr:ATP-binding cassette domain-containing protein [Clostridia bacterium]
MLSVKDLKVHYGAIQALRGISFEVNEGEIVTLIGSNGAGKTTTLHAVSNIITKTSGLIIFEGEDITRTAPDNIVKTGLVQVPEGRRVFANLTVKENLEMGAFTRRDNKEIKRDMEKVYSLFPRLKERMRQLSGTLS